MAGKSPLSHNAAGNGVLEMLLCAPLALFFIFVAVDGGMSHLEREALLDALHTGVISGARQIQKESLYDTNADNTLTVNNTTVRNLTDGVANAINERVRSAKGRFLNSNDTATSHYKVVVSALLLPVNKESGEIQSTFAGAEVLAMAVKPEATPAFDLRNAIPNFPVVSQADFVDAELGGEPEATPSRFALPLGVSYRADNPNSIQKSFLDQTVIIYAEITAIPNGINLGYAQRALGSFYGLQLQELLSVRTILK